MISKSEEISAQTNSKKRQKTHSLTEKQDLSDGFENDEEIDDKSSITSKELTDSVITDDKSSISSEKMSMSIIIDDKNDKQLYRNVMIQKKMPAVTMYSKNTQLRICCNAFTYHRLRTGADLIPPLIVDQRTPFMFIVKSAFILFTESTSDTDSLIKSMVKLSKYDVNKRHIMLEVIFNFIQNKDLIGAKKYIESNEFYLKIPSTLRSNKMIDRFVKCYICYIDYIEWKQSVDESNHNVFYQSNRLIADKTKLSLKNIITETKELVLDYFVLILIEMYEFSQQFSEIFELLQVYIDNNPDHLNAYIYSYNFCVKYPDHSTHELQSMALKYIQKCSPENALVLDSTQMSDQTVIDRFTTLMELIEYKQNCNDINAWTQLKDLITSIEDKTVKKEIKKIWKGVYEKYWTRLHCNIRRIKEMNQNVIELIRCKQKVLQFFYSSSHSYIMETNEKIDEYQTLFNY